MKLSTRSRYGTRLMLELARNYEKGPVQIGEIAKRQDISTKYLEQLIIPLKKANYVTSIRGPKGGHMLTMPPGDISVGEIVSVLENGFNLTECVLSPDSCGRSCSCEMRYIWKTASEAMLKELNGINLSEIIDSKK